MGPLALYRRLAGISIRSQLQYRASVMMQIVGHLLVTGGEFLGIWALFARFGALEGWSLAEVCILYGMTNLAFALADAITGGFDSVGTLVRTGEFDRLLLRPRSTVLLLMGHEFTIRRAGRFAQATIVLIYGLSVAGGLPAVGSAIVLVWSTAGSIALFVALRVFQACFAFKTVESLEIMNVFTYGGVTTASYPFPVFITWFRRLFTFVVPLAAVSYYPGLVLMQRPDPLGTPLWVGWISPVAGIALLAVALVAWRASLRWYVSTGS